MVRQSKAPKGTVSVSVNKNYLRLSWRFEEERYYLSLGLPNNPINYKVAEKKAAQIYLDIISGNFDRSLDKYRPARANQVPKSSLTISALLDSFWKVRKEHCSSARTKENYDCAVKKFKTFYKGNIDVSSVKNAQPFVNWLLNSELSGRTCETYIQCFNAMWLWAKINPNPFCSSSITFKVPPQKKPQPFTENEVAAIIAAFELTPYSDFVKFLFGTGCRPGEVLGLQWGDVSPDFSELWIGRCFTRRKLRPAKAFKSRTIYLSSNIQVLLSERHKRAANPSPQDFVFNRILPNFSCRQWRAVLLELNITPRKLYFTRATFISHALQSGCSPFEVATMAGHDVKTLYKHYAACIKQKPVMPNLF